ncbi:glycosyltransferase [Aquincola sp. S2]|uniref:Glycosyltransferase n=1 Tax=Pseudaquabacterium terrae TaxID=2732868 RepID=A0ABX2EBN1_9BURK|nr:glycosyltransferase [Aquabacterium terrae]NRF66529.1 glycosyltransferase [Aquabacterium terrae]
MKKLLMIAYHFPPLAGSSGIQRTLRFVQHLPRHGWQPLVLSTRPEAYERTADDLMREVPEGTVVRRAWALDTARHLSIGGRYLEAMARPDRWISWRYAAVRAGMQLIREHRPDAIWSTYPIATAHVIGATLQRRSGLPWIADFRDPMAQPGYPSDPKTWAAFKRIEATALRQARLCLYTTPSAAQSHRALYPDAAERIRLLENGYDEEAFAAAARQVAPAPTDGGPRVLLHSGIVYPGDRDPSQLIAALRLLHDAGRIRPGSLTVRFRAAVHDDLLRELTQRHGVEAYVELCPAVGYADALAEMMRVDGLLVLQASSCNEQVPAKLYEYLRAGRPILCLSDPAGDTAGVMRDAGIAPMARLDSAPEIAALIERCLDGGGPALLPTAAAVAAASREGRARQLAAWLDAL